VTAVTALRDVSADREAADVRHWHRVVRRLRLGPRATGLRSTMLTLATYANPDGSRVFPSVETLALDTEQSTRTIKRHLKLLRERYRLIGLVSRGGGRSRGGLTSVYQLTVPTDMLENAAFELLDPDYATSTPATVEEPVVERPQLRLVHSADVDEDTDDDGEDAPRPALTLLTARPPAGRRRERLAGRASPRI